MIVRRHPRRSPPISTFLSADRFAPKFFPLTLLSDPHPLNPVASTSCRNGGERGKGPRQSSAHVPTPLKSTPARQSVGVANKGLTPKLSLLDATLTKNIGGWGLSSFLASFLILGSSLVTHHPASAWRHLFRRKLNHAVS